jgi:hypothetical protein
VSGLCYCMHPLSLGTDSSVKINVSHDLSYVLKL